MEKIDTMEILLAEMGYQRRTEIIGYHINLSRTVSSFRHYLRYVDPWMRDEDSPLQESGTITAKKVYSFDAFLTHSKQAGVDNAYVEIRYGDRKGIADFLNSFNSEKETEIRNNGSLFSKLFGISLKETAGMASSLIRNKRDCFKDEDATIETLVAYRDALKKLVDDDMQALPRLVVLAEIVGYIQMENLAIIAKDTTDETLKMFLRFLEKNIEMEIQILDYKDAYNIFSALDKSAFIED